jgi:hypothetical protein
MFYYRQAWSTEIIPKEQRLASVTVERCSSALGIREPELKFMVESYAGEIAQPERITGYRRDGRSSC